MRRIAATHFAESVMRRYLGRSRASALVGDLLEESADHTHPALHFWVRAGWLLGCMVGRSALAYLLVACVFMMVVPDTTIIGPPKVMVLGADAVGMMLFMLIALAVFSFVRFGPRSQITLLSFGLGVSVLAVSWSFPANRVVLLVVAAVLCAMFFVALRNQSGRRTLALLAVSVAGAEAVAWICRLILSIFHAGIQHSELVIVRFTKKIGGVVISSRDIVVPTHEMSVGWALKIVSLVSLLALTAFASSSYSRRVLGGSDEGTPVAD